MKRVLSLVLVALLISTSAFAQFGTGKEIGPTISHRGVISTADTWLATAPQEQAATKAQLDGYDYVRADFDTAGTIPISIVANLICSNDSIWTSTDSITVTRDSYKVWTLGGCKDYYVYVETLGSGDTLNSIKLTPFNDKK